MPGKPLMLALITALGLGLVVACDKPRTETPRKSSTPPISSAPSSTTPANTPTPSEMERKDGSNPVQGQVDPKQSEQHKDFQRPGEPTGPGTSKPSG